MFIEEDEASADRPGFSVPRNSGATAKNEARLRKRFPVKKSQCQSHCDRLVPVLTGSPWKHYEKRYAIKYWCSFGIITAKSTHHHQGMNQFMIRTITASNGDERVADICRLFHSNIVRNMELYSYSDGSHFLISEFMATSILHIHRSPKYPTEQQLSSILHQVSHIHARRQ